MKVKKLLLFVLIAVCAMCLTLGLVACDNGNSDDTPPDITGEGDGDGENNGPYTLAAPVIVLDGNAIVWDAVENATGYEVYEGVGEEEEQLAVTLTTPGYTIERFTHGVYSFKVKATSNSDDYLDSDFSNKVKYEVPYTYKIEVNFPQDYAGTSATAELYDGQTLLDSCTVTVVSDSASLAYLTAEAEGDYTVRMSGLEENYVANWARVYSESDQVSIKIVKQTSDNLLQLEENTVEVTAANVGQDYIYYVDKTATYSITSAAEGLSVSVNDSTVIDVDQGFTVGSFSAEAGEIIIVTISATAEGRYSFELVDYEIPQYIKVMSFFNLDYVNEEEDEPEEAKQFREEYATRENRILQKSCNRYINVEEEVTYTFQFFLGNLGALKVTFAVNGVDYVIGDGTAFVDIPFAAGENIQIQVSISGGSIPSSGIGFYVFPATAIE